MLDFFLRTKHSFTFREMLEEKFQHNFTQQSFFSYYYNYKPIPYSSTLDD